MSDDLRAQISRTLENAWGWFSLLPRHIAYPKLEAVICADLEPWVEQAIQQEREKNAEIVAKLWFDGKAALAEKDAALQQRVDDLWDARTTLRETPAPPQTQERDK